MDLWIVNSDTSVTHISAEAATITVDSIFIDNYGWVDSNKVYTSAAAAYAAAQNYDGEDGA